MGSTLSSIFGTTNEYQAQDPYTQSVSADLQELKNRSSGIFGMQGDLATALQQQMAGQGPNPSQIQYLNNVGNNIANAQGLIASQRGLNPALAARLGSNVASNENQKSALGSALMQQQQQIQATRDLGSLYDQMYRANLAQQQLYGQGAAGAQGLNAEVARQNAANAAALGQSVIGGVLGAGGEIGAGVAGGGKGKAKGGRIEGKAKVAGDSEHNDVVPAMLSPGEIVIPRTKAKDPDKAKEFIDHLMKTEEKKDIDYTDVLKVKRKRSK